VFRTCDILRRTRNFGSIQWITDPDPDPNPDPALFVSGFRDAKFFHLLRTVGIFTKVSKDNKSLRSHKKAQIKVFLHIFAC
jgi:hypothetical protein